jgi:hypothetical protein
VCHFLSACSALAANALPDLVSDPRMTLFRDSSQFGSARCLVPNPESLDWRLIHSYLIVSSRTHFATHTWSAEIQIPARGDVLAFSMSHGNVSEFGCNGSGTVTMCTCLPMKCSIQTNDDTHREWTSSDLMSPFTRAARGRIRAGTLCPSTKLSQFTKICKSPRLTVMFSGIKSCVSSSMPIRPYP